MNRPGFICFQTHLPSRSRRGGFTLIEVLVAVTLTLVMMAAVVQIFAIVGETINDSRSTLEMSERIRAVASRLKLDLAGVTANMTPPGRPEEGKGYFEYIEGPIGPVAGQVPGYNTDEAAGTVDSTVGDTDDILQFTTRSRGEPFVGRGLVIADSPDRWGRDQIDFCRSYTTVIKSQDAEVSWFLRGTTLYRRVLLVLPSFDADIRLASPDPHEAEVPFKAIYAMPYRTSAGLLMGYYNNYDLSVHWDANANRVGITGGVADLSGGAGRIVCNTLADLTRRECRYAHPPLNLNGTDAFPYALHNYNTNWRSLGLPTLQECSHAAWTFPVNGLMPYIAAGTSAVVLTTPPGSTFDAWVNPYPFNEIDKDTGSVNLQPPATPPVDPVPPNGVWPPGTPLFPLLTDAPRYVGPRVAEDVILTNVLSFDVKAWDPRAPVLLINDGASPPNYNSLMPGDFRYPAELALYIGGGAPQLASHGAYVDLGYAWTNPSLSHFSGMPNTGSGLGTTLRVWDTWSIHYEHDGVNQNATEETIAGIPLSIDEGVNGFDDTVVPPGGGPAIANGVVDDPSEREAPAPYDAPLRGIQIKIRVFDPDSQQVREVTVRQDFMKK